MATTIGHHSGFNMDWSVLEVIALIHNNDLFFLSQQILCKEAGEEMKN